MKDSILKLLQERYFLTNENSWEDIVKRLSWINPDIEPYLKDFKFMFSSPTIMNANTKGERAGTLSSCFTMDIEDSIEGIFDANKECALVTKSGGGVGYNFSSLRGSDELISSLNRPSSGPLPFINVLNATLDGIQQGGVRRGAGMAMLDIDHPNIVNFINAKEDYTTNAYSRFNFSVRMTDLFYERLEKNPNEKHCVKLKDGSYKEIDITVKELWDLIIERAWNSAEPGIFNLDIATKQCTCTNVSNSVLSNPCQEFTHIPYASCNLGSINLEKFVDEKGNFLLDEFEELVKIATISLDNVIDKNKFPIKKIEKITKAVRPIGLGIMGLAHALYKMKITYNSKKAKTFIEKLFRILTITSMRVSIDLAKEHGAYDYFDYKTFVEANDRFFYSKKGEPFDYTKDILKDLKKYGCRNSSQTSVAPTGSIGFIADTSSGIEPVFALTYVRKIEKLDKEYDVVYISDPVFEEYIDSKYDEKTKEKILKSVADNNGSCQKCKELTDEEKAVFVVAGDLTPMEHLNVLEKVAVNTSLSVSKTVNLPKDATKEEIGELYIEAHKRGVIGVTVYREGSREGILIHELETDGRIVERNAPKRPRELPCHVYKITVQGCKWIVFVGLFKNHPYEVFAGKIDLVDIPSSITEGVLERIKSGHYQFKSDGEVLIKDVTSLFANDEQEALTRQISTNLRHGTPIDFVIQQLEKSHGTIVDFNKAILRGLRKYLKDQYGGNCEVCGAKLLYVEGCLVCSNPECGYARCG